MEINSHATVTTNACKLCTPLGACLVFRGIDGGFPFLHGSQGCATYIRRYLISHFKEPMDIASSSISESNAVFGGSLSLHTGLANVCRQYQPKLIGIATTCLSETTGDDVALYIKQYLAKERGQNPPVIIHVATPSYTGTHIDGFHNAVMETVRALAEDGPKCHQVNIFPGFISPADLRHLKEILTDFQIKFVMLPDYADTIDGPIWDEYLRLPGGGTTIRQIQSMGCSNDSIELGRTRRTLKNSAAGLLWTRFQTPNHNIGLPIGVNETDAFLALLKDISGRDLPEKYRLERGRLVDSYVDGHKYMFQKRAIVYGEEDLVIGLAAFLAETGIIPVLCASGGESGQLESALKQVVPEMSEQITAREGVDFMEIAELATQLKPDILIGNSKGYPLSRQLEIPLVRVGFPIHDRLGGQRILHLGYRGTQQLFDRIVNALIAQKQNRSPVGYSYM
jgi:nitrogenase molybdenum-iron protein NifN